MSTPRKSPSQQRSRFTYETILEAAAHVFEQEGISATTNRVADRAGVSIGSLYQYFPNKQALLHELTLRHLVQVHTRFAAMLDQFRITRPSVEQAVTDLVTLTVQEHGHLYRAHQVMREHSPRSSELERRFAELIGLIVDGLLDVLDPPANEVEDVRLRLRLTVAGLDGQIHQVVLAAVTAEERRQHTAAVITQAVRMVSPSPLQWRAHS